MSQRQWNPIKTYSDILFEIHGNIAKVSINRPEVYNAFRPQTIMDMLDAFDICRERADIGVVILTGVGDKAFCSGVHMSLSDIAVVCALGYLDFRFPHIDWRTPCPNLHKLHDKMALRTSFIDTQPQ